MRTLEGESHLVTGGIVSDGRAVVAVLLLLRVIVMTLFAVMLNSLLCYLCDRHSIITFPPRPRPPVVHLTSVITLDAQIKRSAIALHEIQRMQIVLYARLSHKAGVAGKRRFTLTRNIGPLNSTTDNSIR